MLLVRLSFIALTFFLITVGAPVSLAQQVAPSYDFDAAQALQWIPMSDVGERGINIPVLINGKTVNATIDTGSIGPQSVIISKRLQSELQLIPFSTGTANAYGGRIKRDIVTLNFLQIGGMLLTNQVVAVAPEGEFWDVDVDMLIGQELMRSMLLQVDWEKRQVRLLLTGDMPAAAADIPVHLDQRTGHIVIPVALCGKEFQFVLDTGLESDASLNSEMGPFSNCAGVVRSDISSVGLGGNQIGEIVSLPSLQLGTRAFPGIMADSEKPNDPLSRKALAGSIGYGLLHRSNFVLDAGAGQLRFYGPDRSAKSIDRPTLGIQFKVNTDALIIRHLMSNSPAANSALRVGEQICKLNGKAIAELKGNLLAINPPTGTPTSIGLCDGRTVQMVSQDFMAPPQSRSASSEHTATSDPTELGRITDGLARCGEAASPAALDGCSIVVANSSVPIDYRVSAQAMRAQIYDSLGRSTEALADVDALIAKNGDSPPLLAIRAQFNMKLQRHLEAASDLNNALKIDPTYFVAYLVRASLEYKLKNFGKGIDSTNRVLTLAPNDPQALNMLATGYYHQGKLDQALTEVERAITVQKDYADGYATRGQIYEGMGRIDLARSDFTHALKIDCTNADAANGIERINNYKSSK